MRRTLLVCLGLASFRLAASEPYFPPQIVVNLTNQVWRYNETGQDLAGTGWEFPGYDDSAWSQGRSVLALDNNTTVNSLTNTVLRLTYPGNTSPTVTYYFRTSFQFTNPFSNLLLVASNLVDDGYVMYLNGIEVSRYNMPPGPPDATTVATAANPAGEGVYVVRELAASGALFQGENLLAVEVHQNSANSADVVWGMALHVSPLIHCQVQVVSPSSGSVAVLQGRSAQLEVNALCSGSVQFQWFKDFVSIPGANSNFFTITNMTSDDAGRYYCSASNALGVAESGLIDVVLILDTEGPRLLSAKGDPFDLRTLAVRFDEPVNYADDPLLYSLATADGTQTTQLSAGVYSAARDTVTFTTEPALDPQKEYFLTCIGFVEDPFGNTIQDSATVRVHWPLAFRQGALGYSDTDDTEIHSNAGADVSFGDASLVTVDLVDNGVAQGLLKFNNIIGGSSQQLPFGAQIARATLRLYTVDNGARVRMLRALTSWDESSTWNSLVEGINETNGVETSTTDAIIQATPDEAYDDIDVTSAVQAWANGAPNHGWAFLGTDGDGWDWASSEHPTTAWRPTLFVDFSSPPSIPCEITGHPQSVTLGGYVMPHTLSVISRGSNLTYQWYKDGVPIPGANGSTLTIAGELTDSGTYTVVVDNEVSPEPCVSEPAVVTIHHDPRPVRLVSALGNPDQTTITLIFDQAVQLAAGQDIYNYSLNGGVSVVSAAVSNTFTNGVVTLTTTPRVVGVSYTLSVRDLMDNSAAPNLLSPNPTVVNLRQRVRLIGFDHPWKYHNEGADLGTAWKDLNYDDSFWNTGPGLLGFETTAATVNALSNQNLFVQTQLTRLTNIITDYFRTRFQTPHQVESLTFRYVVDDGAVFYLNGYEVSRFNLTNGPISFQTQALMPAPEGSVRTTNISGAGLCGDNVVAVEVHQNGAVSGDVLFGLEILADVSCYYCVPQWRVNIVRETNDTVSVSWPPCYKLYEAPTLMGPWTLLNPVSNPAVFRIATGRFFKSSQ